MNNTIPDWWLYLSGLFFVLNVVLFGALIYLAIELLKFQRSLQPKITELTDRVNNISKNVEEISTHLKETVTDVSGKAKHVAGSADTIASIASHQMERFAPVIGGLMTAYKLFQAIAAYRHAANEKKAYKAAQRTKSIDKGTSKRR